MLEGDWGKAASPPASANVVVVLDIVLDAAAQLRVTSTHVVYLGELWFVTSISSPAATRFKGSPAIWRSPLIPALLLMVAHVLYPYPTEVTERPGLPGLLPKEVLANRR
jgi:hypothetical protein